MLLIKSFFNTNKRAVCMSKLSVLFLHIDYIYYDNNKILYIYRLQIYVCVFILSSLITKVNIFGFAMLLFLD